jgi:hypothetical protein
MLAAIAICEAAKETAFRLIQLGYTQSSRSVECSICGKKYLLLLDDNMCPRNREIGKTAQDGALRYFALRIRESHKTGHLELVAMKSAVRGAEGSTGEL